MLVREFTGKEVPHAHKGPPVTVTLLVLSVVAAQADTAVNCTFKNIGSCRRSDVLSPARPCGYQLSEANNRHQRSPAEISFSDLQALQTDVDKKFANGPIVIKGQKISSYRSMNAAPRTIVLSGLKAGSKSFSEGDFVELSGFIASKKLPPHPNTGESVNCKLKDEPSNDYHINITPAKNGNETEGVVVEMIPQNPHRKNKGWDLTKLKTIQEKQLQSRYKAGCSLTASINQTRQETRAAIRGAFLYGRSIPRGILRMPLGKLFQEHWVEGIGRLEP